MTTAAHASPDVQSILREGAEAADRALGRLLPPADAVPASIHAAMRHSTFAGANVCGPCWRGKPRARSRAVCRKG